MIKRMAESSEWRKQEKSGDLDWFGGLVGVWILCPISDEGGVLNVVSDWFVTSKLRLFRIRRNLRVGFHTFVCDKYVQCFREHEEGLNKNHVHN